MSLKASLSGFETERVLELTIKVNGTPSSSAISRCARHAQWYLDETAETLVHGLCQAFMKCHLPRAILSPTTAAP